MQANRLQATVTRRGTGVAAERAENWDHKLVPHRQRAALGGEPRTERRTN